MRASSLSDAVVGFFVRGEMLAMPRERTSDRGRGRVAKGHQTFGRAAA